MAALGVVVRDSEGKLLVAATKKIQATSPDIAEAKAVKVWSTHC